MIDIEVRGEAAPEPRLFVTLTNQSREDLVTYEHSLPWRSAYAMMVVAVETDPAGTPLERTLPVDDPGPGTVTVKPGETLHGEIPLAPRFPSLSGALAKRDVLAFWAYRFQPVGKQPLPWVAGHVVLERVTA
ncbi:MAG: hypothetical protein QOJ39_242 [Candidatus Eremiobacteraeota bacterium]|nr:hypothetical protein [Candidatus Eremiobacteraeota bacterium]